MTTTAQSYNGGAAALWVQTDDGNGNLIPIGTAISSATSTYTPTETHPTVTTSSTQVLAANANRKSLTLINDGANVIYVTSTATAVANQGIRLNANGGSRVLDVKLFTNAIQAIAVGGSSVLLIEEGS